MENQHRKIQNYGELNKEEIDLMNEAKALGETVGQFIEDLDEAVEISGGKVTIDPRFKAIAKTEIQTGFMWLIRSIAKPGGFC